ncbi:hypothetical protein [Paraburkholderia sp. GAS82]|uniref:hypothetical protein n=1 Tax=Paraburkholderia sp. GAS82 TaxID=3035137 RepID=UPI003D211CA7
MSTKRELQGRRLRAVLFRNPDVKSDGSELMSYTLGELHRDIVHCMLDVECDASSSRANSCLADAVAPLVSCCTHVKGFPDAVQKAPLLPEILGVGVVARRAAQLIDAPRLGRRHHPRRVGRLYGSAYPSCKVISDADKVVLADISLHNAPAKQDDFWVSIDTLYVPHRHLKPPQEK